MGENHLVIRVYISYTHTYGNVSSFRHVLYRISHEPTQKIVITSLNEKIGGMLYHNITAFLYVAAPKNFL